MNQIGIDPFTSLCCTINYIKERNYIFYIVDLTVYIILIEVKFAPLYIDRHAYMSGFDHSIMIPHLITILMMAWDHFSLINVMHTNIILYILNMG